MKQKEIIQKMQEMNNKYTRLLWYARVSPDMKLPRVNKDGKLINYVEERREEIEELYPEETQALSEEHGDWQHGFHSGVVAASRYFLTLSEKWYKELALETAENNFPDLDS
jgi:hypothetical protein